MRRFVPWLLSALLLAALPCARAQDRQTIYRCTSTNGALTIQNGTPCPKGSKQKIEVVESPTVIPVFVPPTPAIPAQPMPALAAAPAPAPSSAVERPQAPPPAAIADADRLPPPPIFRCTTWDNDSYLSEDPEPKPRCVKLQTTGMDGNPDSGNGEACEMKYDVCPRVPDNAACDAWKQRQREIESTWRYAPGSDRQGLQDAFARVTKILTDTTCGTAQ